MDGNREVSEMICTLGKFFRSNIRISDNEIPLEQELENARLYTELSRYRFGDKLHYEIVCGEELRDEKVLRLLLQPLIENSVKHGIEQTGREEHIAIRIHKDGGTLFIDVMIPIGPFPAAESGRAKSVMSTRSTVILFFIHSSMPFSTLHGVFIPVALSCLLMEMALIP